MDYLCSEKEMIGMGKNKNIMYKAIFIAVFISLFGCKEKSPVGIRNRNNNLIESIDFKVVKTYPHDTGAYTEGFLFHDNQLFESTGSPEDFPEARSVFGPVDLKTGKIEVKAELDRNIYFGEGILFFKDKIYQLTYKNQIGFIYDSKTFKQTGTFKYSNKEGWALTTDGKHIIMSDGTNVITFLDTDSLSVIRKLNVTFNGQSALYMNELEYINGYIYANIWTTKNIAKIDPESGKIVGIIDLSSLYAEAVKKNPGAESTNGIAYDKTTDRIFVTGKFWPEIYQIKFSH
jgi:glutamine cyclotransferase